MTTIAIVPAKDRAESIAATVAALNGIDAVDGVVVVDDGSSDATAEIAAAAGAKVIRLPVNRGKGAAVAAGVEAAPNASVYLLIDADLGDTAGLADALLRPVREGVAGMTIAVLPSAGRRGGFGSVRRLAAEGIRRACGFSAMASLSGQRAILGPLLRSLSLADRFGLETALTIDAVRAGAVVREVDVPMDHRHTGRRLSGFRHRGGQAADILRALWPRVTSVRFRAVLIAAAFAVASLASVWSGARAEPRSTPPVAAASKVVIFGVPRLSWDDVGTPRLPVLAALADEGAIAAANVRTLSGSPSTVEGYATVGAGTRVLAGESGALALDADEPIEGGTALEALARRTGSRPDGEVVVIGGPATVKLNEGRFLTSRPGALAGALRRAGRRTAVINNADTGAGLHRPAGVAMMDGSGSVDVGRVGRELLRPDANAPFGQRADHESILSELDRALVSADVVLVDPGETDRAAAFLPLAAESVGDEARRRGLADSDALLGKVRTSLADDVLLVVVSVVPPGPEWHLTPILLAGPGVPHGYLHSPSTRRAGVVTLSDVAPTVLGALDVPIPNGMIGQPLRYRSGATSIDGLRSLDRDAVYREGVYFPLTLTYIVGQLVLYLVALFAFVRLGGAGRMRSVLRVLMLGISAYPLATFVFRAVPNAAELDGSGYGALAIGLLLGIDAVIVALARGFRRHPLSPLSWILGVTVALLAADVATGARLQASSLFGYSLHTSSRFTGLGNTAFAILAAATVLLGAIHVANAPRRREALFAVACLFAFVVLIDGAPTLGSDVGGIVTLVPVFGLTLLVLSGRRLDGRSLIAAAAVTVLALALATGVDLLRPAASRTHLGRLAGEVGREGLGPFLTTASRKLAVNFRTYRSPWSWPVAVVSIGILAVLGWTDRWNSLLPKGSALRAGVAGALAAGLVGYAVNDSGVVVAALVFVYLGPLLTLVALAREQSTPVRIDRLRLAGPIPLAGR